MGRETLPQMPTRDETSSLKAALFASQQHAPEKDSQTATPSIENFDIQHEKLKELLLKRNIFLSQRESQRRQSSTCPLFQQTVKWDPFVRMLTLPTGSDEDPKFECRCAECTNMQCPSKKCTEDKSTDSSTDKDISCSTDDEVISDFDSPSYSGLKKKTLSGNNVSTACSRETMTSQFINASCGACLGVNPFPEVKDTGVSTQATNDVAILNINECRRCRETEGELQVGIMIDSGALANTLNDRWGLYESMDKPRHCGRWHEPERDPGLGTRSTGVGPSRVYRPPGLTSRLYRDTSTSHIYRDTSNSHIYRDTSTSNIYRNNTTSKVQYRNSSTHCAMQYSSSNTSLLAAAEGVTGRRMIYNEGISDSVIKQLLQARNKAPFPTENPRDIKTKVTATEEGRWIPHSHKHSSKYHEECKKEPLRRTHTKTESSRPPSADKRGLNLLASPRMSTTRICCLPRKVITSKKDIECFLTTTEFSSTKNIWI